MFLAGALVVRLEAGREGAEGLCELVFDDDDELRSLPLEAGDGFWLERSERLSTMTAHLGRQARRSYKRRRKAKRVDE